MKKNYIGLFLLIGLCFSTAQAWDGEPGPIEPGSEGEPVYFTPIDPEKPKLGVEYSAVQIAEFSASAVTQFLAERRSFGILAYTKPNYIRSFLYAPLEKYFRSEEALGAKLPANYRSAIDDGVAEGIKRSEQ
ncbi:hypothetical protein [Chitinolyticbacter meiyuanensis]|uniref:hypothetical protein n=1 Tax=Chitinolyticbacter meiyuanensis TaxID=682798 RepID=UPI0011E5D5F7|nr:hypothetical protein [Chitinolyticbacter meiyuanensis]